MLELLHVLLGVKLPPTPPSPTPTLPFPSLPFHYGWFGELDGAYHRHALCWQLSFYLLIILFLNLWSKVHIWKLGSLRLSNLCCWNVVVQLILLLLPRNYKRPCCHKICYISPFNHICVFATFQAFFPSLSICLLSLIWFDIVFPWFFVIRFQVTH